MNYFYDLLINLNDNEAYKFYEWNKDDEIIHLKKVPVFKISSRDLNNLMRYRIKIAKAFLELIYNRTENYDQNLKYIEYMALFTDENNSILLEFNSEGESIYRSYLLLEEELDLMEISYSLPREEISYTKLNNLNTLKDTRQIRDLQKFLEIEVNTLHDQKDTLKMRYLYNEITNKDESDQDKLYDCLINIIKSDFNNNHLKLYNIIKLSYKHLSA